jgi:hypothetical protein
VDAIPDYDVDITGKTAQFFLNFVEKGAVFPEPGRGSSCCVTAAALM